MIKAFSSDVFNKAWNKDYYEFFTTSWEYPVLSMTSTSWNLLLLVSIWGRYVIDKWFEDKNASTMTDIALHTVELARKNDSLQTRLRSYIRMHENLRRKKIKRAWKYNATVKPLHCMHAYNQPRNRS